MPGVKVYDIQKHDYAVVHMQVSRLLEDDDFRKH